MISEEKINQVLKQYNELKAEVEREGADGSARLFMQKIDAAMEALPEEEREIIQLLYIKRYTWIAAGIECKISQNTVNNRRKRAIRKITDLVNLKHTKNLLDMMQGEEE